MAARASYAGRVTMSHCVGTGAVLARRSTLVMTSECPKCQQTG
jgi:DnaJ-class molecular chaperone